MAYPVYEDSSTIATGTDATVAVNYLGHIDIDDILVVVVMDADDDSFATPVGWNKYRWDDTNTNMSYAIFWKRALGIESGTITFTSALTSGSLVAGLMHRFSGCVKKGVPFEQEGINPVVSQSTSRTLGGGNIYGKHRLGLGILICEDNTVTGFNATNGWAEVDNQETTVGSDAEFSLVTREASTTSGARLSVSGSSGWTMSSNEYSVSNIMFLVPESDIVLTLDTADETDFAEDTSPTLEFTANAILGASDAQYQIEIDTAVDFRTGETGVRLATNPAGGDESPAITDGIGQIFTPSEDVKFNALKLDISSGSYPDNISVFIGKAIGTPGSGATPDILNMIYGGFCKQLNTGGGFLIDLEKEIEFSALENYYVAIRAGAGYSPFKSINSDANETGFSFGTFPDEDFVDEDTVYNLILMHLGGEIKGDTEYNEGDFSNTITAADRPAFIENEKIDFTVGRGIVTLADAFISPLTTVEKTYLDDTDTAGGQSFTGNGGSLRSVSFFLAKTSSPTGTAVAKLYAHSGTFGSSSVPTGSALATSETFDVAKLTTVSNGQWANFKFATPVTIILSTKYVIVLEYSGGTSSNRVAIGEETSGGHGGNSSVYDGSWTAVSGTDLWFKIYTDTSLLLSTPTDTDLYYWRVRAKTLNGIREWGEWAYDIGSYYIDGSDGATVDNDSVWTSDTLADDGTSSFATIGASSNGARTTNELRIFGTNSPTTGDDSSIVKVVVRAQVNLEPGGTFFGPKIELDEPSGGWTWTKIAALEGIIWKSFSSPNSYMYCEVWTDAGGELLGTAYGRYDTTTSQAGGFALLEVNVHHARSFDLTESGGSISATINGASTVTVSIEAMAEISATVSANSTVTVNVNVQQVLTFIDAIINGASTVTADIIGLGLMSTTVDGGSTTSCILVGSAVISSTINCSSDTSSILGGFGRISTTINCGSTTSVDVINAPTIEFISATVDGVSTISAILKAKGIVQLSIDTASNVSANIGARGLIAATVDGLSNVTASIISLPTLISSTINGVSTVIVNIQGKGLISSTIESNSLTSANLIGGAEISTTINASSTVTCNLIDPNASDISATINSGSTVTVSIKAIGLISTTINSGSTVTVSAADGGLNNPISTTINGSSVVTVNIEAVGRISATVNSSSTVTVNVVSSGDTEISATVNGSSIVTANILAIGVLETSIIYCSSNVTASIIAIGGVSATINSVSSVTTNLIGTGRISTTITPSSTVTVVLGGQVMISATINGSSTVSCNLISQLVPLPDKPIKITYIKNEIYYLKLREVKTYKIKLD